MFPLFAFGCGLIISNTTAKVRVIIRQHSDYFELHFREGFTIHSAILRVKRHVTLYTENKFLILLIIKAFQLTMMKFRLWLYKVHLSHGVHLRRIICDIYESSYDWPKDANDICSLPCTVFTHSNVYFVRKVAKQSHLFPCFSAFTIESNEKIDRQ